MATFFFRNTTSSQRKRSCTARCNWEACLPFVLGQKWVSGSADCVTDEKSNADKMFRYYQEIKLSALQTGGGASPPSFERSLLPGTPLQQRGATYQTYLEGRGGEYIHTQYIHAKRDMCIPHHHGICVILCIYHTFILCKLSLLVGCLRHYGSW